MSFFGKLGVLTGLAAVLVAGNGCLPDDTSRLDEEREPNFLMGQSRFNAQDYPGAIEAFNEALEANPRSAQAHYQLGCIYDTKVPDPAYAIYHYKEYLRLAPQAANADVIRQHIYSCRQQLATNVMDLPSTPAALKQIENLQSQNRQLQQQVDQLKELVHKWNAYYAAEQAAARATVNSPGYSAPRPVGTPAGTYLTTGVTPLPPVTQPRKHVVQARETLASIARKAGVSVEALQAANPGVSPRRLREGQVLTLPEP